MGRPHGSRLTSSSAALLSQQLTKDLLTHASLSPWILWIADRNFAGDRFTEPRNLRKVGSPFHALDALSSSLDKSEANYFDTCDRCARR